jgi:hypothetical protein
MSNTEGEKKEFISSSVVVLLAGLWRAIWQYIINVYYIKSFDQTLPLKAIQMEIMIVDT